MTCNDGEVSQPQHVPTGGLCFNDAFVVASACKCSAPVQACDSSTPQCVNRFGMRPEAGECTQ